MQSTPDGDDTAVDPDVPAAVPAQHPAAQSDRAGIVHAERGGVHRRRGKDAESASRGYRLAVVAALAIGLLAAAGLTIVRMVGAGTIPDGPARMFAPPSGGVAADPGLGSSPSSGASNTPSPSGLPASRSPSPSPSRPTPTRASALASPSTGSPSASTAWTTLTVTATKALFRGDSVQTNRTRLIMQRDGNLAIIDENGITRWTSGTAGSGSQATFQADGNFVVYDASSRTLWSSRTDRHNGAVLVLQANGDVCIIHQGTPLWCASTAH